jgi:predicted CXXCH cytochrome family protein
MLLPVYSCAPTSEAASDKQPIQYNHQLHVQENDMECAECHLYVQSHARATIPNIEVCADCHSDEPTTESPEEAKLIEYVMEGRRIPWTKVYRVPSHVYFSHRRHTTLGQIECTTCHGNAEEMSTPFDKPLVSMSMNWCMECHERNGVDNDCTRCHR